MFVMNNEHETSFMVTVHGKIPKIECNPCRDAWNEDLNEFSIVFRLVTIDLVFKGKLKNNMTARNDCDRFRLIVLN